ncbi:MAG: NAD(P)/FAD-dependent oxidoreductase, partial [Nanoarchaeota archaeon]|nr:NAD(P)/FAD-dependent oxidoreductase [Nanoarchaeota archaeon]
MKKHDLIIIGVGPGGLTAGIYAARYQMDSLIIGQIPGGYASTAHDIRNYPGFSKISGMELTMKMLDHAKSLEVPIKNELVKDLKKTEEGILVKTDNEEYLAKKIILATGSERRKLGLNKEEDFLGKGISYCATCDAGFQKDKIVGVVGGGDAALTAALLISKFASKVYLFYRKEKFTKPEVSWIKEVEKNE